MEGGKVIGLATMNPRLVIRVRGGGQVYLFLEGLVTCRLSPLSLSPLSLSPLSLSPLSLASLSLYARSNSLATVDVSKVFTGLTAYDANVCALFTALITFTAPLVMFFAVLTALGIPPCPHLAECIYQLVIESRFPHKIVELLFTTTNRNIKLTVLWGS